MSYNGKISGKTNVTVTFVLPERGIGPCVSVCSVASRYHEGSRRAIVSANTVLIDAQSAACRARNKEKHNLSRIMREASERLWSAVEQQVRADALAGRSGAKGQAS